MTMIHGVLVGVQAGSLGLFIDCLWVCNAGFRWKLPHDDEFSNYLAVLREVRFREQEGRVGEEGNGVSSVGEVILVNPEHTQVLKFMVEVFKRCAHVSKAFGNSGPKVFLPGGGRKFYKLTWKDRNTQEPYAAPETMGDLAKQILLRELGFFWYRVLDLNAPYTEQSVEKEIITEASRALVNLRNLGYPIGSTVLTRSVRAAGDARRRP
jgi:hypothetical protein